MPDTTQPRRPRLGRIGLIIWLLTPLAIVAAMWLLIDRSKGQPDPRLMRPREKAAPTATDAKPIVAPAPAR
jgi:hypothetical protein